MKWSRNDWSTIKHLLHYKIPTFTELYNQIYPKCHTPKVWHFVSLLIVNLYFLELHFVASWWLMLGLGCRVGVWPPGAAPWNPLTSSGAAGFPEEPGDGSDSKKISSAWFSKHAAWVSSLTQHPSQDVLSVLSSAPSITWTLLAPSYLPTGAS